MDIASELTQILGGASLKEISYKYKCTKCKQNIKEGSWEGLHPHHVTYIPRVVKYLCPTCHARITFLNMEKAVEQKQRLNAKERMRVWEAFVAEEIHEDAYNKAVEWWTVMSKRRNGNG